MLSDNVSNSVRCSGNSPNAKSRAVVSVSPGAACAIIRLAWVCIHLGRASGRFRVAGAISYIHTVAYPRTERKAWTPTEAAAIARELEPLEREAARERQETQDFGRGVTSENFSEVSDTEKGRALDKVADAVGMSRPTLTKALEIIRAAPHVGERRVCVRSAPL